MRAAFPLLVLLTLTLPVAAADEVWIPVPWVAVKDDQVRVGAHWCPLVGPMAPCETDSAWASANTTDPTDVRVYVSFCAAGNFSITGAFEVCTPGV
ncbi:MAG: hypothetical protein ACLGIK_13320 [Gemmatimonadota bacterium]